MSERSSRIGGRLSRSGTWAKTHSTLTSIISTLTLLATAFGFAYTEWDSLATESEVREQINYYDHGHEESLPDDDWKKGGLPFKSRTDIQRIEALVQRMRKEQVESQANEKRLWWWLIGYVAADSEPCPNLKAAAASFYRAQFKRELRTEKDPEAAYTKALNTKWESRRHLARQGCR